ncbi:hypothetical protein [Pseudomonas pergaminensis]
MSYIKISHAASLAVLLYATIAVSDEISTDLNKVPNRIQDSLVADSSYVDTVDPNNGNLSIRHLDLKIPGNGLPIEIFRNYNMRSTSAGLRLTHNLSHWWTALGLGWRLDTAPVISVRNQYIPSDEDYGTAPPVFYVETAFDFVCANNPPPPVWARMIQLRLPNGDNEELFYTSNRTASSKSNWRLQCINDIITVKAPNGTTYDFGNYRAQRNIGVYSNDVETKQVEDSETYLQALKATDINGNWLTYTYAFQGYRFPTWNNPAHSNTPMPGDELIAPMMEGNSNLLRKIESSDGRQVTFQYNPASGRLQSISDNAGRTIKYGYSEVNPATLHALLTSASMPAGETWRYDYQPSDYYWSNTDAPIAPLNNTTAANRKLIGLHYPSGGKVTYGYTFVNQGARVYSKGRNSSLQQTMWLREERIGTRTLSSGGSWNYTYLRGGSGQMDQTTVTGPDGTRIFKYFGLGHSILTSFSEPVTNFGNVGWKAGSPMAEHTPNNNSIIYDWQPRAIAAGKRMWYEMGVVYDSQIWAPSLMSRTVIRDGATYSSVFSGHDAYGNPTTIVETGPNGGSLTTKLDYLNDTNKWIVGKVKSKTSQAGSMSRTFDTNGKVLSETQDGVTTSYTYDTQGNLASKTLPGNRVHTYSNYKRGIPQTEVQPEGITLTRVVDDAGNITSKSNGEGKTTRYTYDGLGRVTSKTPPLGNVETTTYTPTSKIRTRGNLVETTQYDPFGRVASVTLGGITTRYEHDGLGRRTFVSDPASTTGTRYEYDALDRVTRMTNADTSYQEIAYGSATRTITDERRKATIETYRGHGTPDKLQLMAITAPEPSANVTLTRDAADRITSVKQGAFTRNYGYNTNGYLTSVTNPETGVTTYGRDIAGNMISKQVGASGITQYTYDGLNRLTSTVYPGATPAITNTYNKNSKLLSSNSAGGNRSFAYDAADNLVQDSLALDGRVFTTRFAYDGNDSLSSTTYPQSSRVVNYAPDTLGRPTKISGYVSDVKYWPSGLIQSITYNNGIVSRYEQNNRLWPANFTTEKPLTATYLNSNYTYDGIGNLKTITDNVDASLNRTLDYDGINRLTSVAGFWGQGSIAYDGGGNLINQTLGQSSLAYAYDANNRLSSVSGMRTGSYGYDVYGNVSSSQGNTYTYNDVPNLTCINCANPAAKVEYSYDGLNHRSAVAKARGKVYETHDSNGKQLIELDGGTLTEYFYLGDKRVAQQVSP